MIFHQSVLNLSKFKAKKNSRGVLLREFALLIKFRLLHTGKKIVCFGEAVI